MRKELKNIAKNKVKNHYGIFLIICLTAAIIGSEFTNSLTLIKWQFTDMAAQEEILNTDGIKHNDTLMKSVFAPNRGVLAEVVNTVSTGQISQRIVEVVNSVIRSESVTNTVLIWVSFLFVFALWFFVQNVFSVVTRRIFLEGGVYKKISIGRALFLWTNGKLWKTSVNMAYLALIQFLWMLTIVGGIIKHYSYFMVPYILAENPSLSAREAVMLSRKMMQGHKWECFKLELSFVGWWLLGLITGGLVDLFYVNSYSTATYCEYFKLLRCLAINSGLPGSEAFNDKFLYAVADGQLLLKEYGPAPAPVTLPELKGFRKFCSDWLGISFWDDKTEEQYLVAQSAAVREERIKKQREGLSYPQKLSPLISTDVKKLKKQQGETAGYMRHYSLPNLILMFFIFSMCGWIWEVILHFVAEGEFVNRGMLYGPWLPIYGGGGVMILVLLSRFRKTPWLEFTLTMVLSGILEYFTSFFMELAHGGARWWDYTGYFLNINGRICAEGLLTFGMGGLAFVYILAPQIDTLLQKLNKKLAIWICVVLIAVFATDFFYSTAVPNKGAGITDDAPTTSVQDNR